MTPKSLDVATMPLPKCCCQSRFTITRAVSGLSFDAIQFASAARRPGWSPIGFTSASRSSIAERKPGASSSFAGFRQLPRLRSCVGGGVGPGRVIAIARGGSAGLSFANSASFASSAVVHCSFSAAFDRLRHVGPACRPASRPSTRVAFRSGVRFSAGTSSSSAYSSGNRPRCRLLCLLAVRLFDLRDRWPAPRPSSLPTPRGPSRTRLSVGRQQRRLDRPHPGEERLDAVVVVLAGSGRTCGRGSGSSRA